ncbi:MAG: thrombospondin type 3 repeat-containing protein [Bacillota bacterium]
MNKKDFELLSKRKKGRSMREKVEKDLSMRDTDKDGLTDLQEKKLGTNPINPDTDEDGIPDNLDVHPKKLRKKQKGLDLSL